MRWKWRWLDVPRRSMGNIWCKEFKNLVLVNDAERQDPYPKIVPSAVRSIPQFANQVQRSHLLELGDLRVETMLRIPANGLMQHMQYSMPVHRADLQAQDQYIRPSHQAMPSAEHRFVGTGSRMKYVNGKRRRWFGFSFEAGQGEQDSDH